YTQGPPVRKLRGDLGVFASHGSIQNVIFEERTARSFPPQFHRTGRRCGSAGRRAPHLGPCPGRRASATAPLGVRPHRQGTGIRGGRKQGRQDEIPCLQGRGTLRHL